MDKKLYKIMVWRMGDYDLLQVCDRLLTDDEANNFKVDKGYRGTIEEIKKEVSTTTTKKTETKTTDIKSR